MRSVAFATLAGVALGLLPLAADAQSPAAGAKPSRLLDVPVLREFRTPAYTLLTNEESTARQLIPRLANFDRLLAQLLQRAPRDTGIPTIIFVLDPDTWLRLFETPYGAWSDFFPVPFANYVLISTEGNAFRMQRNAFHQYTHLFLHSQFRGYLPLWFDEGTAMVMQDARLYGKRARIEPRPPSGGAGWMNLPRLLTLERDDLASNADAAAAAATSWAMVYRGLIADTAFGTKMFRLLASVDALQPVEDAAQDSFGVSLAALDTDLRNYVRAGEYLAGAADIELAPRVESGAARVLSERESLEVLLRMLLDTNREPRRVGVLIDDAALRGTNAALLAVFRARLAVEQRDDAALERALADLPALDAAESRDLGLALVGRARSAARDDKLPVPRRAAIERNGFELLQRALGELTDDGATACAYAEFAVAHGESLAQALDHLDAAAKRYPQNANLALCMAQLLDAMGDDARLEGHLGDVLRWSSVPAQRAWAAKRLQDLAEWQRTNAPQ